MVKSLKDAFDRARRKLLDGSDDSVRQEPPISAPPIRLRTIAPADGIARPDPPPAWRASQRVLNSPGAAPPVPPTVAVSVSEHAACALSLRDSKAVSLLSTFEPAGRATQAQVGNPDDKREVVLGLDFGTSCVKVVVGDSALGKAFAVPFCRAEGVARFLLPSRLCQTGRVFSLEAGTHTYRDLKLSLLARPEDPILQQRVVAFLALIIRRARGWLLTEQAASYKRTAIAWKLAVGLPSAQHHQSPLSELFERLSLAAWAAAGASADVTDTAIQTIIGTETMREEIAASVEVTVVPEIAAQIYGFVASNSFDKQAPNIYLMADVGSGTIDSSLFHVKPGKAGRWDFEFYTSVVEPNGVSNLHRHRVNWWTDALAKAGASRRLIDDLEATKLITDQHFSTPESFLDYFHGVDAKFRDPVKTPDEEFFNFRVIAQVQGKTLWRTWKDNFLPQSRLTNIPFFMCGGGVRMSYYQQLEPRLSSMPGYTWMTTECWTLGVPNDLVADGVAEAEYDRLSVAYGLSRLEIGKVVKALPQPKLAIPPVNIWRDNYPDKDQC